MEKSRIKHVFRQIRPFVIGAGLAAGVDWYNDRPFELARIDAEQRVQKINKDIDAGKKVAIEDKIAVEVEIEASRAFKDHGSHWKSENRLLRDDFQDIGKLAYNRAEEELGYYPESTQLRIYQYDPTLDDQPIMGIPGDGHTRSRKHTKITLDKREYLVDEVTDYGDFEAAAEPKNNKSIIMLGRIMLHVEPKDATGYTAYVLHVVDESDRSIISDQLKNSYGKNMQIKFMD
jgi:hypothetical protein